MFLTLKIFVDLVDAQSFSRAAAMNYLTPSAVSQRIQLLEEQVGQQLVLRNRSGVTPTEAGRTFYDASRDMLDRYERAVHDMKGMEGRVSGTVRVGTVTSVGLHELPPYIKVFLKEFPAVDLGLEYLASRDVYKGLLDRSLDLGIVAYPARNAQFATTVFRHDEMVVIVAPEHPCAGRKRLALEELDGHRLVAYEEGNPTGRAVAKRLRQAGVAVDIAHRFDNIETLKRAVEVGEALAIVPRHTVAAECRGGTLVCIAFDGERWERPIAVVRLKGREPAPPAQKFIEILRNGQGA